MKDQAFWIAVPIAIAACLAAGYIALNAKIESGYYEGYFETASQEVKDLAPLIALELTPEQLSQTAQKNGVKFRTLSAAKYSQPPKGTEIVCYYGSMKFFFNSEGRLLALHGPVLEKNPIYQWR